jgi:hypothetical protein
MPEMGLEDEPISPVSRDETVTNKNPNTTIKSLPAVFMFKGGAAQIAATSARQPKATNFIDRSCSVRERGGAPQAAPAPKSANPARMPCQINGMNAPG